MSRIVWLVLAAAGCGDPPVFNSDAGLDAPLPVLTQRAVITNGNYLIDPPHDGVMAELDFAPLAIRENVAPPEVGGIASRVLRLGEELFVVDGRDESVVILDARNYRQKARFATGAGSFPFGVAVVGDHIFVPAMGTAGVLVFTRGQSTSSVIDLSALDPDGKPDCFSAVAVEGAVYVSCQLLDRDQIPIGPAKVVVIDGATAAVTTTLTMTMPGRFGRLELVEDFGELVLPSFVIPTAGCVERIRTRPRPEVLGCMLTAAELGGMASSIASQLVNARHMLWMVITPDDRVSLVVKGYDIDFRDLTPPVTPATQQPVSITPCPEGQLIIGDGTFGATIGGLRVYDDQLHELTTEPLPFGQPAGGASGVCFIPGA